jgi:lipopolysaccharide transport protein LptA
MNSLPTQSVAILRMSTAALAFLALVPSLTAATKKDERPPVITWDAAATEMDIKTHVWHLKDVTITYGKMTVRADRALATAGDFKDSRWTFDGNVRINAVPRGNLRSDQAIVEFEDNQLKRATATGNPAEFDQTREDSNVVIARGHADQIVYEVNAATVRLSNDAWVTDGHNDLRGPVIVYSLREEHVEAMTGSSDPDSRVHGTVPAPGAGGSTGPDTRTHVTVDPNYNQKGDASGTNKPKPTASQTTAPQTTSAPQTTPAPQTAATPAPTPAPQAATNAATTGAPH